MNSVQCTAYGVYCTYDPRIRLLIHSVRRGRRGIATTTNPILSKCVQFRVGEIPSELFELSKLILFIIGLKAILFVQIDNSALQ